MKRTNTYSGRITGVIEKKKTISKTKKGEKNQLSYVYIEKYREVGPSKQSKH